MTLRTLLLLFASSILLTTQPSVAEPLDFLAPSPCAATPSSPEVPLLSLAETERLSNGASASVICRYSNRVNFYAEPEKVTLVGYCRSYCNSPSVCSGTQTAYSTELWRVSCDFQCE